MELREHRCLSFDETPLFYRRVLPDGIRNASILIVHGMGEHGGRYLEFARALAGAGIESLIPDLRGFGRSAGRRGHVGRLKDFSRDLEVLFSFLERENGSKAPFLLGHSFGGLLAAGLAAESSVARPKGLILTSPLFGLAIRVPAWRKALASVASGVFPIYTERAPIVPRLMTHNTDILERDAQDPLIHYKITARLYTELTAAVRRSRSFAGRLRCPTLVLQAGDDRLVSRRASEAFFSDVCASDKELEIYPELYHEILNEHGRDKIYSKIVSWVIERSK